MPNVGRFLHYSLLQLITIVKRPIVNFITCLKKAKHSEHVHQSRQLHNLLEVILSEAPDERIVEAFFPEFRSHIQFSSPQYILANVYLIGDIRVVGLKPLTEFQIIQGVLVAREDHRVAWHLVPQGS